MARREIMTCDRCGKEVNESTQIKSFAVQIRSWWQDDHGSTVVEDGSKPGNHYDLCADCHHLVRKWLDEPRQTQETAKLKAFADGIRANNRRN